MANDYEADCLSILQYMYENEYEGLKEMAAATGVSKDECRRYILPEVKEKRPKDKVLEWRDKNPRLYVKVIETCAYDPEEEVFHISTSKHDYLLHYAERYGYILLERDEYPGFEVERRKEMKQDVKPSELYDGYEEFEYKKKGGATREWVPLLNELED